jgi:prevent-host-death family protein
LSRRFFPIGKTSPEQQQVDHRFPEREIGLQTLRRDLLPAHVHGREYPTDAVNLADAKAYLGELVDRVAAGASIDMTRGGKPVARLTTVNSPRKRIDAAVLRSLTTRMPVASSAASLVRTMRDSYRY